MNTQRAADFNVVGTSGTKEEDKSSSNLVWVLLAAIAIVVCGCCLIICALCSRGSKSRAAKITGTESEAFVTREPLESLAVDMEAPEKDSLISHVDQKPLPFPEVMPK